MVYKPTYTYKPLNHGNNPHEFILVREISTMSRPRFFSLHGNGAVSQSRLGAPSRRAAPRRPSWRYASSWASAAAAADCAPSTWRGPGGCRAHWEARQQEAELVGGNWLPWIWHFPRNDLGCCHHPNWRSHIFQRGGPTTNQWRWIPIHPLNIPMKMEIFSFHFHRWFFFE